MTNKKRALFASAGFVLVLISGSAVAQTVSDYSTTSDEDNLLRPARTSSVAPLTSRFVLNGTTLDYAFRGGFTFGLITGKNRNSQEILGGTLTLSSDIFEGEVDGIYARKQSGWYLQLGQAERKRQVSVTQAQAVDIIGFKLQLSVTGDCMFPGTSTGDLCTYTPSLATDPDAVHPELLIPTRFIESGRTGDVISQETYDAIQEEGWQRGVEGGAEIVGIDMDILNSGTVENIDRSGINGIGRQESIWMRGVVSLSKVDQNLYSNGEKASLDRTIRGFVFLDSDEWNREAVAIQALAWLLPSLNAKLPASGDPNFRINNNLFFAANNQWTPRDSFTVFQTGLGYTEHMKAPPKSPWDTPPAWFNGFWMGFSPVRNTETTTSFRLETTGDRITTHGPYFVQGGIGTVIDFPNSAITIIDDIANQISQIELSSINNLFVQSGLELTSQAALAYSTTTETSYYSLVPHIAFSGNRTDGTSVFRYYAGAFLQDDRNAYLGADYSAMTRNGINYTVRAEKHSNPDRDYYSFAEFRVIKTHDLVSGNKISYGIGGRKAFDRPGAALDRFDSLSRDTAVDFLGRYETVQGLNYDLRHRISEDDNGRSYSTTFGVGYKPTDRLTLTGQITPFSNEDAYIRAQAGFSWRIAEAKDAGVLQLQWADIKYDYGSDSTGVALETSDKSLLASFQVKF